jgi:hypothetical protein
VTRRVDGERTVTTKFKFNDLEPKQLDEQDSRIELRADRH